MSANIEHLDSPIWHSDELVRDREAAIAQRRWVPGEPGIWALVFTELGIFTVYFIEFMIQWLNNPVVFASGHEAVSLTAGILNTLFLLTASLFVAHGVQTMRLGNVQLTERLFLGAGLSGLAFVINKYVEWSAKIELGHTAQSDVFFQLYFIITGIHLLHVIIAMVLLRLMRKRVGQIINRPTPRQSRFIENCATYWHMVDLLWLGIFALFYLMR